MKTIGVQKLICLLPAVLLLVACQQPGQISQANGSNLLGALDNSNNNDSLPSDLADDSDDEDTPIVDDDPQETSACRHYFDSVAGVNLNATNDLSLVDQSGNIHLADAIRNLVIQSVSGNIQIDSAMDVSIDSLHGNLKLNVGHVSSMNRVTGNLCIRADSIGSMTSGRGNSHVVARTIESVTVQSGNFHIYGATVNVANALNGNICLHEGATILQVNKLSGHIRTNCN